MLLDELFPDAVSRSETDSKSKDHQESVYSDEELKNSCDDCSADSRKEFGNGDGAFNSDRSLTKTILPDDLQELVKEALAELKPESISDIVVENNFATEI